MPWLTMSMADLMVQGIVVLSLSLGKRLPDRYVFQSLSGSLGVRTRAETFILGGLHIPKDLREGLMLSRACRPHAQVALGVLAYLFGGTAASCL